MFNSLKILVIFIFLSNFAYTQDTDIFLIKENGFYTYINQYGEKVIDKKFTRAGRFYEGLAVARKNGYVGYINKNGNFEIEANFEYALAFYFGIAKVIKNGKPYLINKKGEILFEHNYKNIDYAFSNSKTPLFIATKKNNKKRIITANNDIIIGKYFDIFSKINQFYDNRSIVTQEKTGHQAVIDTAGNFIVPFGKYYRINNFNDGFAYVQLNENNDKFGFIDKHGKLVFSNEFNNYKIPEKNKKQISNNRFIAEIPIKPDTILKKYFTHKLGKDTIYEKETIINSVDAILNPYGEIIYSQKGEKITDFKNGIAYISEGYFWQIDTFNNIKRIDRQDWKRFHKKNSLQNKNNFVGELAYSVDENGLGRYTNKKGEIIWQEKKNIQDKNINKLNINSSLSNLYISYNFTKGKDCIKSKNKTVKLEIVEDSTKYFIYYKKHLSHTVLLKNYLPDSVFYNKHNGTIKMQAQDKYGNWRDICYSFDDDDCGYESLNGRFDYILPNECRKYIIPQYKGGFKTKLRVCLPKNTIYTRTLDTNKKYPKTTSNGQVIIYLDYYKYKWELINKGKAIYSNEISGSINASQFVRTNNVIKEDLFPYEVSNYLQNFINENDYGE